MIAAHDEQRLAQSVEQARALSVRMFGNADVYVPEGVNTTLGGFGVFGHRRDWGRDAARADDPIIRVRAFSLFGTVDLWRVPPEMRDDYGENFRQLQHRQRRLPAS